jgi:chromate transporter
LSNSIPSPIVDCVTAGLALGTVALLWKFKKIPEPVVIVVAALAGLVLYPLMVK